MSETAEDKDRRYHMNVPNGNTIRTVKQSKGAQGMKKISLITDEDGITSRLRPNSGRKHLAPSTKKHHIRYHAYLLSLDHPENSELTNWLEAELYINTKYPD